jgi:transposase
MRAAGDDTPTLPEDPAALRALLLAALEKCDTLTAKLDGIAAERDELAARNERLHHLLLQLKRRQFGRKSERLSEGQLLFAFEEIEATLAGSEAEAGKQSPALRDQQAKRRRSGRGRLPAHLPRVEVELAPGATACPCCQGPLVEIGVDAAERLDVIPAQFRVVVTKRPKLACRACAGVVLQAPAPARLVEGGMPTEATVAHVLVSRYADHLPLYRQAQILGRQGIEIGREVLADWVGTAALEIVPVVRRMHGILLTSQRLFADETAMPVLDPGPRPDQEGLRLGDRARRPALGRDRPAGGGVPLCAGPWCQTSADAAGRVLRHPAVRRLRRLQDPRRGRRRHRPGVLPEPCPPRVHRAGEGQDRADRRRGLAAHRRALRSRGGGARQSARAAPRRPAGEEPAIGRGLVCLARRAARAPAGRQPDR